MTMNAESGGIRSSLKVLTEWSLSLTQKNPNIVIEMRLLLPFSLYAGVRMKASKCKRKYFGLGKFIIYLLPWVASMLQN
jgi:hypothetical protein